MAICMKQFIDKFKAMEKVANETLDSNPDALVGVDSLPGSEHDATVPAEAKKPDAEVTQGQPSGATSTSGAVNGGDAKPLNEGKLEMDQALENPEKKPLISDDALDAKTANAHLASIVGDLLEDLKAQKKASAPAATQAAASDAAQKQASAKTEGDGKQDNPEKKAGDGKTQKIVLDDDTISKIAAASATFMMGRAAAEEAIKKASDGKSVSIENARKMIKDACVKAAQAEGLNPEEAAAAADNAMAAAGMADAGAAAADAGAAADDAGAAAADAGAAAADAGAAEAQLPDDVTEEELATAIVDLVTSGDLDPDTAKALVEEIASDEGATAPTEDQAAEIIAQGLENGEITPEQAQEIAAAIETGATDDGAAAADAGAASAEAQGAADAEAAAQEAADEAQGAAAAEAAIKDAAAHIRADALSKIANAIASKRQEKIAAANPGYKIMSKVASILQAKKEAAAKQNAGATSTPEERYAAGFKKKAEEMGIDPALLAKYVCENAKPAK